MSDITRRASLRYVLGALAAVGLSSSVFGSSFLGDGLIPTPNSALILVDVQNCFCR